MHSVALAIMEMFIIDARVSARSPRPRPRVSILAAGSRNGTLAAKLQKFSTQRGDSPEALFSVLGDRLHVASYILLD